MSTGWGGSFFNQNPNPTSNNVYRLPSKNNNIIPKRKNTKNRKNGKLNLISIIAIILGILAITYVVLYILHVKNKIHINLPIFPKSKKDNRK